MAIITTAFTNRRMELSYARDVGLCAKTAHGRRLASPASKQRISYLACSFHVAAKPAMTRFESSKSVHGVKETISE